MPLHALSSGGWGIALQDVLLRRTALLVTASQNFIRTKTPMSDPPCAFSLPLLGCLGLFFGSKPPDRAGSVAKWPHPHATQLQREASCAPCTPNNRFLGNLFVHTWTVNQRSTLLSCRGGFALWEMPKYEVCISLLGMRNKMYNPSNKDTLEIA